MDVVAQLNTALAGRYEIEREIGRGGMATVYLAHDTKHSRLVALKVLDPALGAILGVDRFLSEIRVTANLQHPNLLPLFDSGEASGMLYYVMPFVEGESLRVQLQRERQLPVDDAVRMGVAIAGALDYAHQHGVIHRDLKPENILLQSRQPVVADFGIALAVAHAGGQRITQTGLSLGTPQYMSPEQATGDRVIDGRTDIYSLGAVIYEMLTGDPPHVASTAQAIVAKVLTEKPPRVRLVRDTVPEHVDRAVEQALAKLPADRFATASEFADALQGKIDASITSPHHVEGRAQRRRGYLAAIWPWAAALAAATALGVWGTFRPRIEPHATTTRFTIGLKSDERIVRGLALSADASMLVFAATSQLVVRRMSELENRPIPGTANGVGPFFSPDGESVGFLADGKIKRVSLSGGTPVVIVSLTAGGAAWSVDDEIAFTGANHGINLIPVSGGPPRVLTHPGPGEVNHMWPAFLPGRNGIVFTIWRGALQTAEIAVASFDGTVTRLNLPGVNPRYVAGNLVYAHADGSLAAVAFDPATKRYGSERATGDVIALSGPGAADYAIADNGTLVYEGGGGSPNQQPVIVDRAGTSRTIPLEPRSYARPRYSPDGKRIALDTRGGVMGDIWVYEMATQTGRRLYTGADAHQPEWRPDGKELLFTAGADSTDEDLFLVPSDGSTAAQPLVRLRGDQYDATWTPDGRSLVYLDDDLPLTAIATMRLEDRKPLKWLGGSAGPGGSGVLGPRVSPDGSWITYWSNESGREEVYVRPFPNAGGVIQISSGGGNEPIWSRDGRELFYRQGDKLMVASLAYTPDLSVVSHRQLFEQRFAADGGHSGYDVSPDGRSFIFLKDTEAQAQLMMVINWSETLHRPAAKTR